MSVTGSLVSILSRAVYVPGWSTLAAAALKPTWTDCEPVSAASVPLVRSCGEPVDIRRSQPRHHLTQDLGLDRVAHGAATRIVIIPREVDRPVGIAGDAHASPVKAWCGVGEDADRIRADREAVGIRIAADIDIRPCLDVDAVDQAI